MRRIGKWVAALVVLLGLAVYLWPVPRQDFASLAQRVPPETRQSLLDFRQQHPPKTLTVDGLAWEYVVLGQGEATIVFLHGMTGAYDIWWQQMEALAPDYRVISVTYPPVDTLEGLSRGVLAVMDEEGVERAHVVGSSLGGYLAQYLIQRHPQRLERVVLGNTFPPNDLLRAKNEGLIRVLPFLPSWLVMGIMRGSFEEQIYPASGNSELVLAYLLEQVSGRMSKDQLIRRATAVIEPFPVPDPAGQGIPVLIIEADNDPLVPPELRERLRDAYPQAEVHTLHGVGHFPYLNAAETYTALLRDFFAR